MSEMNKGTKYLFSHKIDEHLENAIVANFKVNSVSITYPLDRVFDLAWKLALETNCEVEKQYFSELEPQAKIDYLKWMKSKRYSNLGPDRTHVDQVLNRGLQQAYELHVSRQLEARKAHQAAIKQAQVEQLQAEEEARRQQLALENKRIAFLKKCQLELEQGYSAFGSFEEEASVLGFSTNEFRELRNIYVKDFLETVCLGKSNEFNISPDSEQLWAIGEPSESTALISARAGSGKTTVLALRAVFLIKRLGANPLGMVFLAFNRAASIELKTRIARLLIAAEGIQLPVPKQLVAESEAQFHERVANEFENVLSEHGFRIPLVTTFHALARAIVYSAANTNSEYLAQIVTDEDEERTLLTDLVNVAIERTFRNGAEVSFKRMMIENFQTDWMEILRLQAVVNNPQLAAEYEQLPRDTLRGHSVRSHGEKAIADFLFKRDINYWYEPPIPRDNTVVFPDFKLKGEKDQELFIEFFGMVSSQAYRQESKHKLLRYGAKKQPVLALYPQDISSGEFASKIIGFLESNKFSNNPIRELSEQELWEKLKTRGHTDFNKAVHSFINRANQRKLTPSRIDELLPHSLTGDELVGNIFEFTRLSNEIFKAYLQVLDEQRKTDFNQLLQNATIILKGKRVDFIFSHTDRRRDLRNLTHLFVDEYQDFSQLFKELVDLLLHFGNQHASLTAVGDAWQSINSFMGSDESIIDSFLHNYPGSKRLTLLKNYRSNGQIVSTGNSVMSKVSGEPSIATKADFARIGLFLNQDCSVTREEFDVFGSEALAQLSRLVGLALDHHDEIVVLVRFNKLPVADTNDFAEQISSIRQKLSYVYGSEKISRVHFSTVHKYKGKESEAVIMWDSSDSVYPFVHRNFMFDSFFGVNHESVVREERRLFYVGITRAKSMLLINSKHFLTPFLDGVPIQTRPWPDSKVEKHMFVDRTLFQIFLTGKPREAAIRTVLSKRGFTYFKVAKPYWEYELRSESFNLEVTEEHLWRIWRRFVPNTELPAGARIKLTRGSQAIEQTASK